MARQFAPHFPETEPGLNVANAPATVRAALVETSWLLEAVSTAVGKDGKRVPLRVASGYRTPAHNAEVGGADNSQHTDGTAADFVPLGISIYTFAVRMLAAESAGTMPPYGQVIFYPFDGHIHISQPTRSSRNAKLVKLSESGKFLSFDLKLLHPKFSGVLLVACLIGVVALFFDRGA